MAKTETDIQNDSKARMKRYRAEMIEKGYISTTVFLSKEHRAELKRLGDEYRLTRAEAAEHIFKAYLGSDNKDVTQAYNINTDQISEIQAAIEALDIRLTALEKKDSNQADDIKAQEPEETTPPAIEYPDQPTSKSIPDILEGIAPENITREERDQLVLKLYEEYPDKAQAKDRIRVLNDAGILLNGEPWTTKQYSDQLNLARRRVKK